MQTDPSSSADHRKPPPWRSPKGTRLSVSTLGRAKSGRTTFLNQLKTLLLSYTGRREKTWIPLAGVFGETENVFTCCEIEAFPYVCVTSRADTENVSPESGLSQRSVPCANIVFVFFPLTGVKQFPNSGTKPIISQEDTAYLLDMLASVSARKAGGGWFGTIIVCSFEDHLTDTSPEGINNVLSGVQKIVAAYISLLKCPVPVLEVCSGNLPLGKYSRANEKRQLSFADMWGSIISYARAGRPSTPGGYNYFTTNNPVQPAAPVDAGEKGAHQLFNVLDKCRAAGFLITVESFWKESYQVGVSSPDSVMAFLSNLHVMREITLLGSFNEDGRDAVNEFSGVYICLRAEIVNTVVNTLYMYWNNLVKGTTGKISGVDYKRCLQFENLTENSSARGVFNQKIVSCLSECLQIKATASEKVDFFTSVIVLLNIGYKTNQIWKQQNVIPSTGISENEPSPRKRGFLSSIINTFSDNYNLAVEISREEEFVAVRHSIQEHLEKGVLVVPSLCPPLPDSVSAAVEELLYDIGRWRTDKNFIQLSSLFSRNFSGDIFPAIVCFLAGFTSPLGVHEDVLWAKGKANNFYLLVRRKEQQAGSSTCNVHFLFLNESPDRLENHLHFSLFVYNILHKVNEYIRQHYPGLQLDRTGATPETSRTLPSQTVQTVIKTLAALLTS